jgi:hypothetical protein
MEGWEIGAVLEHTLYRLLAHHRPPSQLSAATTSDASGPLAGTPLGLVRFVLMVMAKFELEARVLRVLLRTLVAWR